ncbi:hypothetical protein M5K25_023163 [Dendrobium thyrsiflorum]|uniref:Uncharacterized protein n=1 Tax=Dendrobium thyrsiflorum TaxID=117978 RepID=A0ABD0U7G8_DENTH
MRKKSLQSHKKKKPKLDSLDALQGKLKQEVMSKRFLLILDDIWGEEEERYKSKWENVLAPLSCGSLGSKILVTIRMDSAALIIAKVMKKNKETLTLEGLDEDECLLLLNTHAFAPISTSSSLSLSLSLSSSLIVCFFLIAVMAEWFVGQIMDKIINTCFEYLKDQVLLHTDMKEALERLQKLHPVIQSVIFACNKAQIIDQNPDLNRWLWKLRDAIDEADDLLDDFEYMKHEEQLTKNNDETEKRKSSSSTSFLLESVCKIFKVSNRTIKMHPNLNRLKEVVQKLDKVSAEVSTFLHLLESTKQQEQQHELYKTRETGSFPGNDLIGRGKEKEFVMQWLMKPSNEHQGTDLYRNISLLSIVGHGGMGKTTLLQHVYENEMTEEFNLKMWVCVSNNFDAKKVIADMLQSHKKEKPNLDSLDALQGKLKQEVMSKRFLLVLDDIWGEEEERYKSKWENVLAPLSCGSLGSKILVTTRMDSAASIIAKVMKKNKETLTLQGLDEDECLLLLNTHAFADVENLDDHKKLRLITGQIAKKLSGSPLAAKVMGGILNSDLDETRWGKVLDFDTGIIKLGQNDIMPVLRLSYVCLPQSLQSCFTFCCIFPQDHEFDKDDLVRMWIALGFIQSSSNQRETMEDIGGRYFDILVNKSFFDKYGNYYKMHDLLQELAQYVSSQECFRIEGENELSYRIPETIRHLAVNTNNLEVVRKIEKFKSLHSLHLTYSKDDQDFVDVLTKTFEILRSIRLLCINNQQLEMIPEAIGCLRHLRYLKIARTSVAQLPRSLSNLYHLMFIIYDKGGLRIHNDFLPKDLNNLFNLRYLKFPWDDIRGMHGIGKLKSLQGLDGFYIKNEIGYKFGELEHMNELRQLRIKLLKNVKDAEEACTAKICEKRNLVDLSLEWNHLHNNDWRYSLATRGVKSIPPTLENIFDPYLDEKVLDNLQPHNSLKQLRIFLFMGTRSARWMNDINLISNLECIRLEECLKWQTLPPLGQLPFLKYLLLRNMPKAKLLDNKFHGNCKGCLFPSLKVLEIENLEVLEDWFDAAAVAEGDCLFPCLTELYLRDCQHLQELPFLPPNLKKLEIDNIGWKTFNWLQCASNGCIQELKITRNDELISFPIEAEQWFLQASSSLHKLYFMELKSLLSLPSSLASLSSLKILHVKNAPQLQMLPNIPASLEKLVLDNLKSLQCLPSSLSISSLAVLELSSIPLLKSLPDLPPSLRSMNIYCGNLYCLPSCLPSLSYLQKISISDVPLTQELPKLPSSLCELSFINVKSLQSLPPSLTSLSSLEILSIINVTQLRLLPNFPTSLERLSLRELKSLQCLPSSLSSISSLKYLYLGHIPLLKSLPDFPPFLCWLHLCDLENLDCLPSYLSGLSSLKEIRIANVPRLQELPSLPSSLCQLAFSMLESLQLLPNIPASLEELNLSNLKALQCLPSSLSISSLKRLHLIQIPLLKSLPDLPQGLKYLHVYDVPQLKLLPNIPASLVELDFSYLEALQCMPSSLSISSLKRLHLVNIPLLKSLPDLPPGLKNLSFNNVPQLQLLPNIPASLEELNLPDLEALQCLPSSLSISSLKILHLLRIPLLKSLPDLPPGLNDLSVNNVPQLQLKLSDLGALQCLPSSLSISSLKRLDLFRIPLLKSLPDLPPGLNDLSVNKVPQLQVLSNIPASLERLKLSDLEALQCLPSSLSISSLKRLHLLRIPLLKSLPDLPPGLNDLSVNNVPQLQVLPNIPASLEELKLSDLGALQCLPSSLSISSLKRLDLFRIPLLKSLPDLPPGLNDLSVNKVPQLQVLSNIPASLERLKLSDLETLQCLPSSLSISSLKRLHLLRIPLLKSLPDLPPGLNDLSVNNVPQLQVLPNIPASLEELKLSDLGALQCLPSSLSISSLKRLDLFRIPLLKSLPDLPPGLNDLSVNKVPQLQVLSNIPASLERLKLSDLEALQCLPSSLSISSLKRLHLLRIPLLKSLPDLPPGLNYLSVNKVPQLQVLSNIPASLERLNLSDLEALQCLPSSLSISSLERLLLTRIPLLKSLPDLPPGLKDLLVEDCHPELMERYQSFSL